MAARSNGPSFENPFAGAFPNFDFGKMPNFDFQKMFADFKAPAFDVDSLLAAQRRNIEALNEANKLVAESMQAIFRRQAEILRQTMEEAAEAFQKMSGAGTPEQKVAENAELLKSALERSVANMRELSEMAAKANNETFQVINKRMGESLDEFKTVVGKSAKR